jgi:hypothetical protein
MGALGYVANPKDFVLMNSVSKYIGFLCAQGKPKPISGREQAPACDLPE